MTKKTKLLVIALAIAAVVIVSLVATVIIMSRGNKPAPVQPKEDPISSNTSSSNTNVSSIPTTEDPTSSVPESTPSVPPDNSQVAEAVPIDEYPGVFPLDQWGGPIFPNYQVGESIIAYAESLGFSQFIEDGVDENSGDLSFYIGGSSYDDPGARARVNYWRGRDEHISVLFNYTNGDSTSIQIGTQDFPEWVGGYDDFPDELAEHVARFLGHARSDVYRNTSGTLAAETKFYQSYRIIHIVDGVMTTEEENWSQ